MVKGRFNAPNQLLAIGKVPIQSHARNLPAKPPTKPTAELLPVRKEYTIILYLDLPSTGERLRKAGLTLTNTNGKKLYFTPEDRALLDMWIQGPEKLPHGYCDAVVGWTLQGESHEITTSHIFWHVNEMKSRHEKKYGVVRPKLPPSVKTISKSKRQPRHAKREKKSSGSRRNGVVFLTASTLLHINSAELSNYAVHKSNLREI